MWGLCYGVCVGSVWVVVRRWAGVGGALAVFHMDGGDKAEEGDDRLGERPEGALAWREKRVRKVQRAGVLEPSATLGVMVDMVSKSEGKTGYSHEAWGSGLAVGA